jgi:hypothetical protein
MKEEPSAMNFHPKGETGTSMIDARDRTIAALRQMTEEQLLHLGTRQVVYLKTGTNDGELAFMLYSADGTPLVMVDSVEAAVEMVAEHGLGFVSVH